MIVNAFDSERSAVLFTSDDNVDDDDDDLFAIMSKSSKTTKSVSVTFSCFLSVHVSLHVLVA